MATNKPKGDNRRKGAVKKRTQLKNPLTKTMTKRNKVGGKFMAVKKTATRRTPAAKKLASKSTSAAKKSAAARTLASKTPARKATAKRTAKKS